MGKVHVQARMRICRYTFMYIHVLMCLLFTMSIVFICAGVYVNVNLYEGIDVY